MSGFQPGDLVDVTTWERSGLREYRAVEVILDMGRMVKVAVPYRLTDRDDWPGTEVRVFLTESLSPVRLRPRRHDWRQVARAAASLVAAGVAVWWIAALERLP